jgi:hypothetical protein
MNNNLIVIFLSALVLMVALYEIIGLGGYTWINYLQVVLWVVIIVISLNNIRLIRKEA